MKKMKRLAAIAMLALTVSVGAGMVACTPVNNDSSSPVNSESTVTP